MYLKTKYTVRRMRNAVDDNAAAKICVDQPVANSFWLLLLLLLQVVALSICKQ